MTGIKGKVTHSIDKFQSFLQSIKFNIKKKLNLLGPVMIQPYYGFGNGKYFYIKGRVIEKEKIKTPEEIDNYLENIQAILERYESDEIPGAKLKATFNGISKELETDDEGFFEVEFNFKEAVKSDGLRISLTLELLEEISNKEDQMKATGIFYMPVEETEIGIISDLDDTVIDTKATHFLKKMKTIFLQNSKTRKALLGIAEFLRALHHNKVGKPVNPLFYLSGSSWNIFDLLIEFFDYNKIPHGPVFLKDVGIEHGRFIKEDTKKYKLTRIRKILDTNENLNFILIGDSGQKDPEVYLKVIEEYPDRILSVYIRDVTDGKRDKEVERFQKKAAEHNVDMIVIQDTVEAARHAARKNFIDKKALKEIEKACENVKDNDS